MSVRTNSIILSLLAGTILVAADDQQPAPAAAGADAAKAEKPAALQYVGSIRSKKGVIITVVKETKDAKEAKEAKDAKQVFELNDKVKITIDGKEGNIKHLESEMLVTVTYDAKGVISVDATSPKKKSTKK